MPIFTKLQEFKIELPSTGCLLGIDHGSKKIGVAVSDFDRSIAIPLMTLKERKFISRAQRILSQCEESQAVGIIVGLPLKMDGSEGKQCQSVRAFAYNINHIINLPISFYDERLSSFEAKETMIKLDTKQSQRKDAVHRYAASCMLQWALDAMNNMEKSIE